jgi:putative membrane-bound dehydrogenase-like protein
MTSCRINHYFLLFFLLLFFSCTADKEKSQTAPLLFVPDDLEATVWAESPMFYNPTNIDVDIKGRIWVTEAVDYRNFNHDTTKYLLHPQGDRVMILEDTNGDGKADTSKVFVQDKDLVAPLGISVIGNKIIVSCSPNIIVYTDENGDDQPDRKEIFLTGFGGKDHDHGLHTGTAGPDGKLYFIAGNAGPHMVKDKAGFTLRAGSVYTGGTPFNKENTPAMKSDDGRIWTGGVAFSVNPDGTGLKVLGHNFRNSYEVAVDSYGNLWQSDNDDEVDGCRTSFVMEGGNAGYFSSTGERTWQADKRPGQTIKIAHWHQEDPGVQPSGDMYGAGAPTGIVVNEGDELGAAHRGLLLSCDAGRNTVFGYHPKLEGAGYDLSGRTSFIASVNKDNEHYRWNDIDSVNTTKWFRPSDVEIGTDGAIYVADWYDPVVGGHQMLDKKGNGRIYRIAPKNKKLTAPVIDLKTTSGQITALLNPAINVRNQGFELLKAQGSKVLPEVKAILSSENPYHRARAVWLLSQLGDEGIKEVDALLQDADVNIKITAFRALRQADATNLLLYADRLAKDKSPAVRREVAVAMRDLSLDKSKAIIFTLIDGFDGKDRAYLNALGIALSGKEEAFYPELLQHFNAKDAESWSEPLAAIVWELHPPAAVAALQKRVSSAQLSAEDRKKALVALAFIPTQGAVTAMLQLQDHAGDDLNRMVKWWLVFRKTNNWTAYLKDWKSPIDLLPEANPQLLKYRAQVADTTLAMNVRMQSASTLAANATGKLHLLSLFVSHQLPDTITNTIKAQLLKDDDRNIKVLMAHYFAVPDTSYQVDAIAGLSSDAGRGKGVFIAKCVVCHKVGSTGQEIGPDLTNIQTRFDKKVIIDAIANPASGIAFGLEPWIVTLKNGAVIYGIQQSGGAVVTIMDTYGRQYIIEASQIENKKQLNKMTIMPPPEYMPASKQEIADVVSYLLQNDKKL